MTKKIMHIIGSMNIGGAETFLINVLKNIDAEKYKFVFVCYGNSSNDYDDEINKNGGRIVNIGIPSKVGYRKHLKELKELLIKEQPDVLHTHTYLNSAFALLAAKKMGLKTRIVHSHTSQSKNLVNFKYKPYEIITKYIINRCANVFLACGTEAGKSLFYKKNKFDIIYNGIDVEKFIYCEKTRIEKRKELDINQDTVVIGHVGRFEPVKNHSYIIDVFEEYLKINKNSRLLLIGDGNLKADMEQKAYKENICDKVLFLGKRKDVNELYSLMDLFIFPSLYEGFPLTLIETQINGLKALVSSNVDKSVKRTKYIGFFDINNTSEDTALLIDKSRLERNMYSSDIKDFDIKNTIKILCKYYDN